MKLYKGQSGQLTSEIDLRATFDTHRKEDDEFAREYATHEFDQFLKDNGFQFYGYHQTPESSRIDTGPQMQNLMKLNEELKNEISKLRSELCTWRDSAIQYKLELVRMRKLVLI